MAEMENDILSQDFPDLQKIATPDQHFSEQADENSANPLVENASGEVKDDELLSPSPPMSRIGVNVHKAGMEGLDKKKINQIILEASKGSSYYQNELKKEQKVSERIVKLQKELEKFTATEIQIAEQEADREITQLETERDLSNIIVHVDMDAFYAAVEMRDEPKLKSVPMAVGGNSMLVSCIRYRHYNYCNVPLYLMQSTSNYLARRYGVRAGMPGFIGRKLCPELVIVGLNFDKYHRVSEQVRKVLAEYDPKLSPVGLDECYLNLTQYVTDKMATQHDSIVEESDKPASTVGTSSVCALTSTAEPVGSHYNDCSDDSSLTMTDHENTEDCIEEYALHSLSPAHWRCAEEIVQEIRSKIEQCTGLTASAGIAHNRMLSKVASDLNKPNGQFTVPFNRDALLQFVRNLSIRKVRDILY